jgi:hypothetical protein
VLNLFINLTSLWGNLELVTAGAENFMKPRVIIYICERLAPAIISIMHKVSHIIAAYVYEASGISVLALYVRVYINVLNTVLYTKVTPICHLFVIPEGATFATPRAVPLIIDYPRDNFDIKAADTGRTSLYIKLTRKPAASLSSCYRARPSNAYF